MGLLTELIRPRVMAAANPNDQRYWSPVYSALSTAGIQVTPDVAFACSCLYQGVRLISETVGSLSVKLYRELDEDHKELARDNPLWPILRRRPNGWQTAQEFREVMTARALLWSNAFAEIVPGRSGAVEELIPLDPDRVAVDQLPSPSRRLRYTVTEPAGTTRTLVQDQVFHLRGFGLHAVLPTPLLRLARDAVGLWLALEQFESLFFLQGARPGVVLEHPGTLSPQAHERLRADLSERIQGLTRMHQPFVLEENAKLKEYGFNLRDSQATESRMFMVAEIARWLNLPEYKLGGSKQPTFASVEQFARDYVDTTIRPWCTRWEQTIERDLVVVDAEVLMVKFILDSLLRGATLDRANAYAIFVQNGILSENEIRVMEDRNPVPGLDEPRRSANQDRGGDPNGARSPRNQPARPAQSNDEEGAPEDDGGEDARGRGPQISARRARLAWTVAAARVVRKEIAAIAREAPKVASDPVAWRAWVREFYGSQAAHTEYVTDTLQLEPAIARRYAAGHEAALLAEGLSVLERWNTEAVEELLRLAAEEVAR